MKHYITGYDKITEQMVFQLEIPKSYIPQLFKIMNWQDEEDQIYVYNLTAQQVTEIATWLNTALDPDAYIFQHDCFVE